MTLGELRDLTKNLPDDFKVEISVSLNAEMSFLHIDNISVDIGYSSKEVHFFGDIEE